MELLFLCLDLLSAQGIEAGERELVSLEKILRLLMGYHFETKDWYSDLCDPLWLRG